MGAEHQSRTILVVDNEPGVRSLITRILEREEYRIVPAENGLQGLRIFDADPTDIDLVITDAVMPEMGGHEMVHRMRLERPDLPVVFMSGYSDFTDVAKGEELAAFVSKPFDPRELVEKVGRLLERNGG